MRIGYCSPFNPMKSGISDFSEELIAELKKLMEIVIFSPVKPANTEVLKGLEVHMLSELDNDKLRDSLDLIVYHIGNNYDHHGDIIDMLKKYGGVAEIHEIGLHHIMAKRTLEKNGKEAYINMVRYCHGERGVAIAEKFFNGLCAAPWEEHPLDMCMAREIVDSASAVITHSEMVKQFVLGINDSLPIANILLHAERLQVRSDEQRRKARKKLNLPQNDYIIGAFGFATSTKRIIPTLDALQKIHAERDDFVYCIVGQANEALNLDKEIKSRGLGGKVVITGFVTLEEFKDYMDSCDFCLNLRYPTQGETSGSLHRMFGKGIPAIVTDVGTFGSYPDDVVIKVSYDENEVEDIYNAVKTLLSNKRERIKRSEASFRFAQEYCDIEKNAVMYQQFFKSVIDKTWEQDYEDRIISLLCELGLTEKSYIEHIYESVNIL